MTPPFYRGLALFLTLLTGAFGLWTATLKWEPQAPFDIMGILWALTNLPNLFLWGVFFMLLSMTLCCWIGFALRSQSREIS